MTTLEDVSERLRRIETKVVRGFEELGVDTDVQHDWLTVDDPSATLYISTLGRSLIVIKSEARKRGAARRGKSYDIVHRGEVVGTIML